MATAMPTPFDDLISKLIGSQTNVNEDQTLSVKNLINQLLTTSQQQQTQQNQNQTTTGTNTSTTSSNADISALQKVFQQQQAGVTPEMLSAIFSEGAKAVPQLTQATANAVGARSGSNSPLATALTQLNSSLTNQAAQLNTQMLAQSGETAAKIADLTKQQTTSGTTGQTTTGTTTGSTNTTGTQNTSTDQTQNSTKDTDTTQRNTVNVQSSAALAALAALTGGLGGGSGISDILKKLIPGGSGLGDLTFDNLSSLIPGFNFDFLGGAGNPFLNNIPNYDPGSLWGSDLSGIGTGNWGGLFGGMADGGLVDIPKLVLGDDSKKKSVGPQVADLLALAGGISYPPGQQPQTQLNPSQELLAQYGPVSGLTSSGAPQMYYGTGFSGDTEVPNTMPSMRGSTYTSPDGKTQLTSGLENWLPAASGYRAFNAPTQQFQDVFSSNGDSTRITTESDEDYAARVNAAYADYQKGLAEQFGLDPAATYASSYSENPLMPGGKDFARVLYKVDGDSAAPVAAYNSYSPSSWVSDRSGLAFLGSSLLTGGMGGLPAAVGLGTTAAQIGGAQISPELQLLAKLLTRGKADGGHLPPQPEDPKGIKDTMLVPLSGGEFIVPTDVTQKIGPEVLQMLVDMLHTPAQEQQ